MTIFTEQFVIDAMQSIEEFPIDFDDVWGSVGYSTKQKALERLESTHIKGEDFLTSGLKSPRGGRPGKYIVLTIDAFKSFCMVAETEEGRKARKYFIDVEKAYRADLERQFQSQLNVNNDAERIKELEKQIAELKKKSTAKTAKKRASNNQPTAKEFKKLQAEVELLSSEKELKSDVYNTLCELKLTGYLYADMVHSVMRDLPFADYKTLRKFHDEAQQFKVEGFPRGSKHAWLQDWKCTFKRLAD